MKCEEQVDAAGPAAAHDLWVEAMAAAVTSPVLMNLHKHFISRICSASCSRESTYVMCEI